MNLLWLLAGLILDVVIVFRFHNFQKGERQLKSGPLKAGEATCFVEPLLLPIGVGILLAILPVWLLVGDGGQILAQQAGRLGMAFLHITLYYALLLPLLPLLRREVSAQACALLWLLPSALPLIIIEDVYRWGTPRIALPLPLRILFPALVLWALGFVGAMGWQLLSHLRLRRRLQTGGRELRDPWVHELWSQMARYHGVTREIPLLVCPEVGTPVTVGCFERTMFLALPRTSYSQKEWELIFRHELRHIIRRDSRTKVLLGFCAAMCWFNPLGWIACRKAAEDLELSCDEAVLEGEDQVTRQEYAHLLLNNAGTGRGYTTCLSAAAGALRHRLRNVVRPEKRRPGGLVVGTAMLLLFASLGMVALADSPASARELIFDRAPGGMHLDRVMVEHWPGAETDTSQVYVYDAQGLTEYLSSLPLRLVYVGSYEEGERTGVSLIYEEGASEEGREGRLVQMSLYDSLLMVHYPYENTYLVEGGVDWTYLSSLMDPEAPNPDPTYYAPKMSCQLTGEEDAGQWMAEGKFGDVWENVKNASRSCSSRVVSIQDAQGKRAMEEVPAGIGGHFGGPYREAKLTFSSPPEGGYTVTVERWDGSESYNLSSQELEGDVLPLAPYSAHYTVYGCFPVGDALYEMEFYFDIGQDADREMWQNG